MSKIVSGKSLETKIRDSELIEHGKEYNCKGLKYDLVFSGRYLKAKIGGPVEYTQIPVTERSNLVNTAVKIVQLERRVSAVTAE